MKTLLIICSFVFGNFIVNGQTQEEINYFDGTLSEALAQSEIQNKPVFIVGHTEWCGYCKKLERKTFKDSEIIEILNTNYICLSVDMEKGEGPSIRSKYKITGYPTMLILNFKGNISKKIIGYHEAPDLLRKLK